MIGVTVYPPPVDEEKANQIQAMSHEEMCEMWRFAPSGHQFFDTTLPYYRIFRERLFKHFGGFTPEISKKLGWGKEAGSE